MYHKAFHLYCVRYVLVPQSQKDYKFDGTWKVIILNSIKNLFIKECLNLMLFIVIYVIWAPVHLHKILFRPRSYQTFEYEVCIHIPKSSNQNTY